MPSPGLGKYLSRLFCSIRYSFLLNNSLLPSSSASPPLLAPLCIFRGYLVLRFLDPECILGLSSTLSVVACCAAKLPQNLQKAAYTMVVYKNCKICTCVYGMIRTAEACLRTHAQHDYCCSSHWRSAWHPSSIAQAVSFPLAGCK